MSLHYAAKSFALGFAIGNDAIARLRGVELIEGNGQLAPTQLAINLFDSH